MLRPTTVLLPLLLASLGAFGLAACAGKDSEDDADAAAAVVAACHTACQSADRLRCAKDTPGACEQETDCDSFGKTPAPCSPLIDDLLECMGAHAFCGPDGKADYALRDCLRERETAFECL